MKQNQPRNSFFLSWKQELRLYSLNQIEKENTRLLSLWSDVQNRLKEPSTFFKHYEY